MAGMLALALGGAAAIAAAQSQPGESSSAESGAGNAGDSAGADGGGTPLAEGQGEIDAVPRQEAVEAGITEAPGEAGITEAPGEAGSAGQAPQEGGEQEGNEGTQTADLKQASSGGGNSNQAVGVRFGELDQRGSGNQSTQTAQVRQIIRQRRAHRLCVQSANQGASVVFAPVRQDGDVNENSQIARINQLIIQECRLVHRNAISGKSHVQGHCVQVADQLAAVIFDAVDQLGDGNHNSQRATINQSLIQKCTLIYWHALALGLAEPQPLAWSGSSPIAAKASVDSSGQLRVGSGPIDSGRSVSPVARETTNAARETTNSDEAALSPASPAGVAAETSPSKLGIGLGSLISALALGGLLFPRLRGLRHPTDAAPDVK
ncbi:MAG: hypothetical protein M3N47_06240 [Chloroflexota bacterium]|nr:hypothetical protein [Chloroflexota bacterium]